MTADGRKRLVLIADSDLGRATALNHACTERGYSTIVARDLPTALLMISQHLFDAAIISTRIAEEADGWSLAAVFRLVFPSAYVGVLAREKSVPSLQAAINSGADDLFETASSPEQVAAAMTAAVGLPASSRSVQ